MRGEIEPFYAELGARIQILRDRRGLSQERLGRLLSPSVTRTSIANIEAGKQRLLAHTLWQLARILDARPEELVEGPGRGDGDEDVGTQAIERELGRKLELKANDIRRLVSRVAERRVK